MARKAGKRKDSPEPNATADAEELKVGDMSVSQLRNLLGIPAPGKARAEQVSIAVARQPINPETRVADLTVGELLQFLATGHW